MASESQDGKVGRHLPYMWHVFSYGDVRAWPRQERICLTLRRYANPHANMQVRADKVDLHHMHLMPNACWLSPLTNYYCYHAGPWKELIDTTQEFKLSVELDETRRTAFKRASNSMQAVAKRIKADRSNAASLAVTGTLGMAASIGSFASQGPSLTSKISASQYSLGGSMPQCNGIAASVALLD